MLLSLANKNLYKGNSWLVIKILNCVSRETSTKVALVPILALPAATGPVWHLRLLAFKLLRPIPAVKIDTCRTAGIPAQHMSDCGTWCCACEGQNCGETSVSVCAQLLLKLRIARLQSASLLCIVKNYRPTYGSAGTLCTHETQTNSISRNVHD